MASAGRARRIGLLGGSFNPAHDGHLFIARLALAKLNLDRVWWLVAPHNPLKPLAGMAPFEQRLERARRFAAGERRIWVTGLERALATRCTAATLRRLAERCPHARFLWLMGADNLAGMHRWRRWAEVFATTPVAVFDRAPYSLRCLASPAAIRFRRHRLPARQVAALAQRRPPAWVFLAGPRHPASASAIRAGCRRFGFAGQSEKEQFANKGAQ